jgi:hypothetical protein
MKAAEHTGTVADARRRVRALVAQERPGGFVGQVLGTELGM